VDNSESAHDLFLKIFRRDQTLILPQNASFATTVDWWDRLAETITLTELMALDDSLSAFLVLPEDEMVISMVLQSRADVTEIGEKIVPVEPITAMSLRGEYWKPIMSRLPAEIPYFFHSSPFYSLGRSNDVGFWPPKGKDLFIPVPEYSNIGRWQPLSALVDALTARKPTFKRVFPELSTAAQGLEQFNLDELEIVLERDATKERSLSRKLSHFFINF
jgi:hypothetical protein